MFSGTHSCKNICLGVDANVRVEGIVDNLHVGANVLDGSIYDNTTEQFGFLSCHMAVSHVLLSISATVHQKLERQQGGILSFLFPKQELDQQRTLIELLYSSSVK